MQLQGGQKVNKPTLLFNTSTAMSTNIVDTFVDGYLSVSSAGNNCCIRPMLFLWH